jgi:hypothetical protein
VRAVAYFAFFAFLAACDGGSDLADAGDPPPPPPDAMPRVDAPPIIDGGACNPTVHVFATDPSPHVNEGTSVSYSTNPPSSGPHYPKWARWNGTYGSLARPYWVHNLEHGGVVFLFQCGAAGCPEVVGQLEALQDSLERDPLCAAATPTRTLVVADELLPDGVQVAASAWGATYTASCFDEASLRSFYLDRFGRGSEATCAQGSVP